MSTTQSAKVSRSVALDKRVAMRAAAEAKAQNRSFSNYVETILAEALSKPARTQDKPARKGGEK